MCYTDDPFLVPNNQDFAESEGVLALDDLVDLVMTKLCEVLSPKLIDE